MDKQNITWTNDINVRQHVQSENKISLRYVHVLLQIRSSASIGISIYQARDINHTLNLTGARLYIVFIMKTYGHENGAMVKSISISKMHIFLDAVIFCDTRRKYPWSRDGVTVLFSLDLRVM